VIAAVLIAAPWRPAGHTVESSARSSSPAARVDRLGPAFGPAESAAVAGASAGKAANAGRASSNGTVAGTSASARAATIAPTASGPAAAPGRVQELGASIRLATTPGEVQAITDRVSRLATSEGGYTQSSHVNTGEGTGEANLTLSLPSAKLSAALASLGALAPVRAESQTLQDITNTYNAARQRLSDATAERQALLRALAKASTEGEIDSLRERLAQNRGAITNAHTAFQEVSQRASTSEVEVTVVGDRSVGSEGLTLNRGLHDAGRVLVVTLAILLIAAAVLVPLALVIFALAGGHRAWRRRRRERVLDAR
jgi:cellobiose-specific phosphotransferase system component IIA